MFRALMGQINNGLITFLFVIIVMYEIDKVESHLNFGQVLRIPGINDMMIQPKFPHGSLSCWKICSHSFIVIYQRMLMLKYHEFVKSRC